MLFQSSASWFWPFSSSSQLGIQNFLLIGSDDVGVDGDVATVVDGDVAIGADGDGCDWGANGVWDFVVSDLVA